MISAKLKEGRWYRSCREPVCNRGLSTKTFSTVELEYLETCIGVDNSYWGREPNVPIHPCGI